MSECALAWCLLLVIRRGEASAAEPRTTSVDNAKYRAKIRAAEKPSSRLDPAQPYGALRWLDRGCQLQIQSEYVLDGTVPASVTTILSAIHSRQRDFHEHAVNSCPPHPKAEPTSYGGILREELVARRYVPNEARRA